MNTNLPQIDDDGQYLQFVVEVEKISKLQVSKIGKLGSVQEQTLEGRDKKAKEAVVMQYMRSYYDLGVGSLNLVYQGCHKLALNTDFENVCDVNLLYCIQQTRRSLEEDLPVCYSEEILIALSIFYVKNFKLMEECKEFLLEIREHLEIDCQKLIDYFTDSFVHNQQTEIPRTDKYIYETIYESEMIEEEQIKELVVDIGDQVVNFEKAKTIPEEIERISDIMIKASDAFLTQEETKDFFVWYEGQKEKEEEKEEEKQGKQDQELDQKEDKRSHVVFDMSEYLEYPGQTIMARGARSDDVDQKEEESWGQTQYSDSWFLDIIQQNIYYDVPIHESLDLNNTYFEEFFNQGQIDQDRFEIQQRSISWRDGVGTFHTYDIENGWSFVNSGSPLDTYSQLIFCFCNNIPDYLLDDDLKQTSLRRDKNVKYGYLFKAMKAFEDITEKQILIYLCVKEIFFKNIKLKVANASIVSFLYLTCNLEEVKRAILSIEFTALQDRLIRRVNKDLEDILKEVLYFKVVKINGLIIKEEFLRNRIDKVGDQYLMSNNCDQKLRSFEVRRFRRI